MSELRESLKNLGWSDVLIDNFLTDPSQPNDEALFSTDFREEVVTKDNFIYRSPCDSGTSDFIYKQTRQ